MITTTFPDHADQTKPFPKIMRHREYGALVLMRDARHGTVLHTGQSPRLVGDQITTTPIEDYEDYNGPVTLQNK